MSRLGSGSLYCTGAALCNQILCCSVDVLNFYALHLNVTSRLSYSRRKESLTYLLSTPARGLDRVGSTGQWQCQFSNCCFKNVAEDCLSRIFAARCYA